MASLVSLPAFDTFLGGSVAAENGLRQQLLDNVEALFLQETGRSGSAFAVVSDGRIEVLSGTGTASLFLDYPIADVTDIKLGFDTGAPDETLDPDDKDVVIWRVGSTQITRVDGGVWGRFGLPAYCHITYDTQADLPADASLAVISVAATIYRQRGAEDASSETIGGQTSTLRKVSEDDPLWQRAVSNHTRLVL